MQTKQSAEQLLAATERRYVDGRAARRALEEQEIEEMGCIGRGYTALDKFIFRAGARVDILVMGKYYEYCDGGPAFRIERVVGGGEDIELTNAESAKLVAKILKDIKEDWGC
jgi:hypothetical protein